MFLEKNKEFLNLETILKCWRNFDVIFEKFKNVRKFLEKQKFRGRFWSPKKFGLFLRKFGKILTGLYVGMKDLEVFCQKF